MLNKEKKKKKKRKKKKRRRRKGNKFLFSPFVANKNKIPNNVPTIEWEEVRIPAESICLKDIPFSPWQKKRRKPHRGKRRLLLWSFRQRLKRPDSPVSSEYSISYSHKFPMRLLCGVQNAGNLQHKDSIFFFFSFSFLLFLFSLSNNGKNKTNFCDLQGSRVAALLLECALGHPNFGAFALGI